MNRRRFWRRANRVFNIALLIALPVLLFLLLRATDWDEVFRLLREYRPSTLALGMLIALCSYAIFSSFDVLSRLYIGHPLPVRRVFTVASSAMPSTSTSAPGSAPSPCATASTGDWA